MGEIGLVIPSSRSDVMDAQIEMSETSDDPALAEGRLQDNDQS
jgi:hypothetical protein